MYLESVTDQQFLDFGQKRQVDLLAEHCAGIDQKIRSAHSRQEAENIAELACGKLKEVCLSSLVQGALVHRTREFITMYWGNAGKK